MTITTQPLLTIEDLEKTKAIGMNDFVSKPIDEQLLYNKILALVVKAS